MNIIGLDLGQQGDFSALARVVGTPGPQPTYTIPTLHRWPLGTSYTQVGRDVAAFLKKPGMGPQEDTELVVDETGVGLAVVELVKRELVDAKIDLGRLDVVGVTITAGAAVTRQTRLRWHVAKRQLVSCISAVVHSERLIVARDQPEAAALLREMSTFKAKIDLSTGNESFEAWRERDHDDLVLAVALALWAAERPRATAGAI